MELSRHIDAISRDGQLFADAVANGDLDNDVPACPGWTTRDLIRHLGMIHLWAASHVAFPHEDFEHGDEESEQAEFAQYWPDLAIFWPADDNLVEWYLRTNQNLIESLTTASPDVEAYTFLPAPSPLQMWARRQAHEIAIHRFDAEEAGTAFTGFDPGFAADGIDELLVGFAPRKAHLPVERAIAMMVHATDTDDRWHVTLTPDGITTVPGEGQSDAGLSGRAANLYLSLWNRGDESDITVSGDHRILDLWHDNVRVRWS